MKKYYFVSYTDGERVGHGLLEVAGKTSLTELAKQISNDANFKRQVTILCLKDLSEDEFRMLSSDNR